MPEADLLFSDILYPVTENYTSWQRGHIAVSDGVISDLGPELARNGARVIDGSDLVLLPALHNTHTHGHDLLWRGSRDDDSIDRAWPDWFRSTYPAIPLDGHLAAARVSYAMNAMSGVTYVADHVRRGLPAQPFEEAMRAIGLDGRVYGTLSDGDGEALSILHETSAWFEASLERAASLSRRPIMMHAQETSRRVEHVRRRYGKSTVALLDEHGLLHDQTFLVHLTLHSDADLELIVARGAHVVITPIAEMKLGEETFDPLEAAAHGISILIGTDGPAYHNGEDLFRDLQLLSLRASAKHGAGSLPPGDILALATWKAADALGRPRAFPALGAVADFVLLDTSAAGIGPLVRAPFDNVAQQVVHHASRAAVRYVIAGGRLIVDDRRPTCLDLEAAFAEHQEHAARLFKLH